MGKKLLYLWEGVFCEERTCLILLPFRLWNSRCFFGLVAVLSRHFGAVTAAATEWWWARKAILNGLQCYLIACKILHCFFRSCLIKDIINSQCLRSSWFIIEYFGYFGSKVLGFFDFNPRLVFFFFCLRLFLIPCFLLTWFLIFYRFFLLFLVHYYWLHYYY